MLEYSKQKKYTTLINIATQEVCEWNGFCLHKRGRLKPPNRNEKTL